MSNVHLHRMLVFVVLYLQSRLDPRLFDCEGLGWIFWVRFVADSLDCRHESGEADVARVGHDGLRGWVDSRLLN